MARLQLYAHPESDGYLLDVQADLFENFTTRVVVPLLPRGTTPPLIGRLHPVFTVDGQQYVMATHLIATVPKEMLIQDRGNLSKHHDRIVAALDMLFQGF